MKKNLDKIKKIVFACLLGMGITACSDFLNYDESSDYSEEQIFTNFTRTRNFVTDIYSYLPSDFAGVDGAMHASGCDEAIHVWNSSSVQTFTNGKWSPYNTVDDLWGHYYRGIRAANLYLEKGSGRTFDDYKYDQNYELWFRKYQNYEWEVRFLRAFFHFELIKRYGGVPIVTKTLTPEEANNQTRASFEDCVEFIVQECDAVARKLPIAYDNNYETETGRVPRAAAYALKSRVLLYAASPLHNTTNNLEKWKRAAFAAQQLMDSASVYKIATLQMYETITNNSNSTELIWERRDGKSGYFERANYPIGFEGGNTGTCPTQNLVDAYEMKSGSYDPTQPYKNRDPRLDKSIVLNNTKWVYGETVEAWDGGNSGSPKIGASPTGYYLKKYLVKDVSFKPGGTSSFWHSWVLFRYGEVLLNYAEAVNEVVGPNVKNAEFKKTAVETINLIRRRTLLAMPNVPTSISNEDFKEKVRNERFVELAFEDHRFWDIRRWKIGDKTTDIYGMKIVKNEDGTFTYTKQKIKSRIWNDKYYFYPISQSEINKNGKLKQNPGWD